MSRLGASAIVLVLLAATAGLVAWRLGDLRAQGATTGPGRANRPAVAVEVAPIESGRLREVRVFSGALEAAVRFDVAAKVRGRIERIDVDLGDPVRRGQVVATIDDDEFVQTLAQAEAEQAVRQAEVAQARAELFRVERDYERLQSLSARGIVSDTELDEISASLQSQTAAVTLAEARVRQAEATVKLARIELSYTSVRGLWEGGPDEAIVGERYQSAGNSVQENAPLLNLVGLDPLEAIVSVSEADYKQLSVGQVATLTTDARPGETFTARIERIAPVFRTESRQARVELRVDNPEQLLRPGMFIRVRLVLRETDAAVIVPTAAVIQRGDRQVVYTLDAAGETVSEHEVRPGVQEGARVEILAPALTGRVVVMGQHLLEPGAAVTVAEERVAP